MRVQNTSYRSHYIKRRRPVEYRRRVDRRKAPAMYTLPYRTLMHSKRWATNGLNAVLAETLDRVPADDQVLVLRLLDHIQAVDEIFSRHLEARPHGYQAPRSAELPSFETLASKARSTADWYADYADGLGPERIDEVVAFSFANGEPARMTRGEMLLHVAIHGAGHRGQVALLLQKNGIQPFPDRITDFLLAEDAGARREPAAEVMP
jgi:uncharacterized damage-inducible protein DinB